MPRPGPLSLNTATVRERWGLADATRDSVERHEKLPPAHLAKMRLLWSVLRMWMEWQYAWDRYQEFHDG